MRLEVSGADHMPAKNVENRSEMPDPAIREFVLRMGLVRDGAQLKFTALTGGVASDIWRVDDGTTSFCIKRALSRLRVAADWRVPVERSRYEASWLRGAAQAVPGAAPAILADDPVGAMFAMEYLPPERFVWWKGELLAGRVDLATARAVGDRLVRIHAAFARDPQSPSRFPTDAIFHAIRLEAYLLATAKKHPDCAATLEMLAERTAATKRTVVHGDVSPKNIVVGPEGPVFLDAECAWYGDPAFDLAFCLNHLLLKCLPAPQAASALLAAFLDLVRVYLRGVDWESPDELEARAASLLPGLFLARVDGKSPVEYLTEESDKERVRRVARGLLINPLARLAAVSEAWGRELGVHAAK
jgi:5-methylthioribose kinase